MSNARNLSKVFSLGAVVSQLLSLAANAVTLNNIAVQGTLPTGASIEWTSTSLPTGFIWADGAVLLPDTPHQALRDLYIADGFPHGQDGSGNPKVPDARGRTTAAPDNMGGTPAGRLSLGGLGAAGGVESVTLTAAQSGMPAHAHTASSSFSGGVAQSAGAHSHTSDFGTPSDPAGSQRSVQMNAQTASGVSVPTSSAGAHTHSVTGSVSTSVNSASAVNASQAHTNVQPTLVLPRIVKT